MFLATSYQTQQDMVSGVLICVVLWSLLDGRLPIRRHFEIEIPDTHTEVFRVKLGHMTY